VKTAKPAMLAVSQIRTDGGTQSRAALSEDAIADYAAAYAAGGELPPLGIVFDKETKSHWLWDGFHREAAARRAGIKRLPALLTPGTQRDAVLMSVGANARHGLRRTNEDKRRAAQILLSDQGWGARSDAWIAETAGVSRPFVAELRAAQPATLHVVVRQGLDGKTRRLPQKEAEAGGGEADVAEPPTKAVREAPGTAQPGDVKHDDGANTRPPAAERSASPANVPPDDDWGDVGEDVDALEAAEVIEPTIDMGGLTASQAWLKEIRGLQVDLRHVAGILSEAGSSLARVVSAGAPLHESHAKALKAEIAEATWAVEARIPKRACRACRDPDGSEGRRATCGVCLGQGYIVASQEAAAVVPAKKPPRARPAPLGVARTVVMNADGSFEHDADGKVATVPVVSAPARRAPPRNRIVLERDDGTEVPFNPTETA
jgi:hypothetical protein